MSNTLFENLSEAELTALAVKFGLELPTAPKEQEAFLADGSRFELVRLLNFKQFDDDEVVAGHRLGTLKEFVPKGAVNKSGKAVNRYDNVWSLRRTEGSEIITWLKERNDKPKASTGKPKGQPKAETVDIKKLIAEALAEALGTAKPSTPTIPEGVAKINRVPAKPETVFSPGDVIWIMIDGEAVPRQITDDAKRLNKTIVGNDDLPF